MNVTFTDIFNKRWTFLHVPKSAGKSISAYIINHSKSVKTLHNNSHASVKEMKELNEELGTTFAVFRNPYSRIVSLYKFLFEDDIHKITSLSSVYFKKEQKLEWYKNFIYENGKLTFDEFCKKLPNMPMAIEQYHYLPVDKILKFESLNKDFKTIQKALGSTEPLYKINSTNNKNWQSYYNTITQGIVYEIYKKDFKLLNYSKDINNSSI